MQVQDILKNKTFQATSAAVVAFAGGFGVGYILAKKKHEYTGQLDAELYTQMPLVFDGDQYETEDGYAFSTKIIEVESEDVTDAIDENWKEVDERIEMEKVNVFTVLDEDWDYDAELAARNPMEPYVIHQDEFMADEMDFRQETLTYYAGDDIMVDTDDTPIYNYTGMMGELKFGHGSKDKNVVYIRSEVLHMEWEILLHQGFFEQEVLGLKLEAEDEAHLRHSVLKFRRE